MGAGNPVVAAGSLHRVEALVDQHHHGVFVIGLDLFAVRLVRIPGVARHLADAGDVGAEEIGERFQRPGICLGVLEAAGVDLGDRPVLIGHHAADHLELAQRQRVLEGEDPPRHLRLHTEIALQCAFEEARPLGDARHLFVEDQRRRPVDALDGLHREGAEIGATLRAPVALASRPRAVAPEPVAEPSIRADRLVRERLVDRERIVGRDDANRERLADERVDDAIALPDGEPGEHREAVGIESFLVDAVHAGAVTHDADVAGDQGADLGRAHLSVGRDGGQHPFAGDIAFLGDARMFDQDDDRMVVTLARFHAGEPGIVRDPADADLARIHEIADPLDVRRAAFEVVRDRGFFLRRLGIGEFGVEPGELVQRVDQLAGGALPFRRRYGRARRFPLDGRLVARQRLEREETEMKRPAGGTRFE